MLPIQIEHYRDLFSTSPIAAAILDAKTLKLEVTNPAMLELWDRAPQIIGLPIVDFMPEIAEQEFLDLLKGVAITGRSHHDKNAPVMIERQGKMERVFMDYSYTPIMGSRTSPVGILVTGTELTEKQLNTLSSEEHNRNLRAMVLDSPVAMCIYRGYELKIEVVNDHMLNLWQVQQRRNTALLNYVFFSGMPANYTENGIYYSCTALRDGRGNSIGCVLIGNKVA